MKVISNNKITKKAVIKCGITGALTHIDWSVDSKSVVINSGAYEIKFVDVEEKS